MAPHLWHGSSNQSPSTEASRDPPPRRLGLAARGGGADPMAVPLAKEKQVTNVTNEIQQGLEEE